MSPLLIIYNVHLLPEGSRPKGIQDLARLCTEQPNLFRNRVAVFGSETQSNGILAHKQFVEHVGPQAWDWFKAIGPNARSERTWAAAVEKILTGEYVAGYFLASGAWQVLDQPDRGRLLGWNYVSDGQPVQLNTCILTAGGRNKNAAKLWLDVTLSPEGQSSFADRGRVPVRPGVEGGGTRRTIGSVTSEIGEKNLLVPRYEDSGIEGYKAFLAEWNSAFGRT